MSSDIIYLFPNIFLSKINNIKLKDISDRHITKIITTKNKNETLNKYDNKIMFEQIKINKDSIDFNSTYRVINECVKNNECIILCDDDFDLILVLIISFFSEKSNSSFYKCTRLLCTKSNTKIEDIDELYLKQLFNFQQKN